MAVDSKDEKDRLGRKRRDAEAAREQQWAAKQDAELLNGMRQRLESQMTCPSCKRQLEHKTLNNISMLACPDGDGAWIEGPAMEALLAAVK